MSACDYYATVTLPDGRQIDCHVAGWYDYSCNGFDTSKEELEWKDGGELTADECNEELVIDGKPYYLHEYVIEQTLLTVPEVGGTPV